MSWINILGNIFFAVLITSAAGNIMFLFWFLCQKILPEPSPKFVYYMLKWVVIMFLLPITYIGVVRNYKTGYVYDMEKASEYINDIMTNYDDTVSKLCKKGENKRKEFIE